MFLGALSATAFAPAACNAAPSDAVVRVAERLSHRLSPDLFGALMRRAWDTTEMGPLHKYIADDFRNGRVVRLDGVSLSEAEAVWVLREAYAWKAIS